MSALIASWAGLEAGERKARLRALAGLAHAFIGHEAAALAVLLREAEDDVGALGACDAALARLPTSRVRRALSVLPRVL